MTIFWLSKLAQQTRGNQVIAREAGFDPRNAFLLPLFTDFFLKKRIQATAVFRALNHGVEGLQDFLSCTPSPCVAFSPRFCFLNSVSRFLLASACV